MRDLFELDDYRVLLYVFCGWDSEYLQTLRRVGTLFDALQSDAVKGFGPRKLGANQGRFTPELEKT